MALDVIQTSNSRTSTVGHAVAGSWNVKCAELVFDYSKVGDHSATSFNLIGQVNVPANSYILDIQVHGVSLWVSGAAVSMIVGDGDDDNGFHTATDLKATDLLAGEANTMEHPGGKAGAYTASEQRVFYSSSKRTVIAKLTVTNNATAVSAGETRVLVMYAPAPEESVIV